MPDAALGWSRRSQHMGLNSMVEAPSWEARPTEQRRVSPESLRTISRLLGPLKRTGTHSSLCIGESCFSGAGSAESGLTWGLVIHWAQFLDYFWGVTIGTSHNTYALISVFPEDSPLEREHLGGLFFLFHQPSPFSKTFPPPPDETLELQPATCTLCPHLPASPGGTLTDFLWV